MRTLLIINIFLAFNSFSQNKVDTMFIGDKKIILKKVNSFFATQSGPVMLPSEYEDLTNYHEEKKIEYRRLSDSTEETYMDNEGTTITTKRWKKSCDSSTYNYINLYSFVDTIFSTTKDIEKLRPYIKTGTKKYYLCAARLRAIKNGNMYISNCSKTDNGYILDFLTNYGNVDDNEIEERKKTIYVLDNLYYTKNKVTYFLDREFIIKVK